MCGFLNLGYHTEISLQILKDAVGVCRWVPWKCLETGDYTPLLLVLFYLSFRESEIPGFSWLVGYEKMTGMLGNQLRPLKLAPNDPVIIRDNKVRPCL